MIKSPNENGDALVDTPVKPCGMTDHSYSTFFM